jgi:hypothetical protein
MERAREIQYRFSILRLLRFTLSVDTCSFSRLSRCTCPTRSCSGRVLLSSSRDASLILGRKVLPLHVLMSSYCGGGRGV